MDIRDIRFVERSEGDWQLQIKEWMSDWKSVRMVPLGTPEHPEYKGEER